MDTPSPSVYSTTSFGVGRETHGFLRKNLRSVSLQLLLPRLRLDYGQFRLEPAITGLDWLFTPNPKLEKHLSVELLQASTKSYLRFTLLRISSSGFGLNQCDLRHFHTCLPRCLRKTRFPCDYPY